MDKRLADAEAFLIARMAPGTRLRDTGGVAALVVVTLGGAPGWLLWLRREGHTNFYRAALPMEVAIGWLNNGWALHEPTADVGVE